MRWKEKRESWWDCAAFCINYWIAFSILFCSVPFCWRPSRIRSIWLIMRVTMCDLKLICSVQFSSTCELWNARFVSVIVIVIAVLAGRRSKRVRAGVCSGFSPSFLLWRSQTGFHYLYLSPNASLFHFFHFEAARILLHFKSIKSTRECLLLLKTWKQFKCFHFKVCLFFLPLSLSCKKME